MEDMQVASEDDVETAVKSAKTAFPSWKDTPATVRGKTIGQIFRAPTGQC